MKLKNLLLSLVITSGALFSLQSQDLHFSMWDMSPLTTNPAFTGAFSGTFRVGGIYRDQWRSIIGGDAFRTPSIYVDAPILRGFRKNDWIGVGAGLFSDKAGSVELGYSGFMGSATYHLALNKKGTTVLTLGAQFGKKNRNWNPDPKVAQFGDGLESGTTSNDVLATGSDKADYNDWATGLLFKSNLNKTMDLTLGFAINHLTRPREFSFGTSGGDALRRPMLTTLHGQFNIGLTPKWVLTPQFFYQTTAGAQEIALQSWLGYKWNQDYNFRGGLGYRLGDAVEVLLGVDYKDLRVTAAYDVNISPLNEVSNYQGGFEIAAWYIVKIFKKPDVKPAILCPKL